MKILITGGGCIEPIDRVRSICNFSTGKTSIHLSEALTNAGANVTLIQGRNAAKPENPEIRMIRYGSFQDLYNLLQKILFDEEFDIIIHAAAVSDFSVSKIENSEGKELTGSNKIDSDNELIIRLKRNPKIISSLKSWSCNKDIILVGFKLTRTDFEDEGKTAVKKLSSESGADLIIWNDLKEISKDRHKTRIYNGQEFIETLETKKNLSDFLISYFSIGD